MSYDTTHKTRISPIFVVRHLVSDMTNSPMPVRLCKYPIKGGWHFRVITMMINNAGLMVNLSKAYSNWVGPVKK
jgi:hypothetical protein